MEGAIHDDVTRGPVHQKEDGEGGRNLDGELQSRYNKIHGDDGLCHALVEFFYAMAEIRMKAKYGDYLAHTCAALKTESMKDMAWKIDWRDWQEVAQQIEKEEKTKAEPEARRLALSPTPYLDEVKSCAGTRRQTEMVDEVRQR